MFPDCLESLFTFRCGSLGIDEVAEPFCLPALHQGDVRFLRDPNREGIVVGVTVVCREQFLELVVDMDVAVVGRLPVERVEEVFHRRKVLSVVVAHRHNLH